MQNISGDAIEHAWRNILTDQPHQMLRNITITGSAEFKTSISEGGAKNTFNVNGSESELSLKAIMGLLDNCNREDISCAIEATVLTPEWAEHCNFPSLKIRPIFVGYTSPSHIDTILDYAASNPNDWINEWLQAESGNDEKVRQWVMRQIQASKVLQTSAEKHGYPFFDISIIKYSEYINLAVDHLMSGTTSLPQH